MGRPPGERLFAQYAHAPNALGYCGPSGAALLEEVARGAEVDFDVREAARRFSGAWPYQQILGRLAGVEDPLAEPVVRGYWTGNELTATVSTEEFGRALLDHIAPLAGHYWAHLGPELLAEAAPTHAFHVLGVYPWSRLLPTGRPEPLEVLESCRIGWAVVEAISGERAVVSGPALTYDGELSLSGSRGREVATGGFVAELAVGDRVAVHWDRICDRLDEEQAASLEHWTRWQIAATNPRLRAAAEGGGVTPTAKRLSLRRARGRSHGSDGAAGSTG